MEPTQHSQRSNHHITNSRANPTTKQPPPLSLNPPNSTQATIISSLSLASTHQPVNGGKATTTPIANPIFPAKQPPHHQQRMKPPNGEATTTPIDVFTVSSLYLSKFNLTNTAITSTIDEGSLPGFIHGYPDLPLWAVEVKTVFYINCPHADSHHVDKRSGVYTNNVN
ncbi:Uncharacterized protein Fot_01839 [Forsythia ovata]|uniref:Uncharacterized protein n=1 Tax=Forsythia ovata TaxID=205694 RepID=A0ABD1X552_9LAMI